MMPMRRPWSTSRVEGQLTPFGHLGRLNKKAAKAFGLKEAAGPVYVFELDAQALIEKGFARRPFVGWSKFPPNQRDMALVLNAEVPASEVLAAIKAEAEAMPLTDALIFDLYQGEQLPAGRKSLAFRLTFQSHERTLTDDEVGGYFDSIRAALVKRFEAELRS